MENILELKSVTKQFERFTLDGLSFALPKGFIMGLIGSNGAGKTTTLKLILKTLRPNSGQIRLFGDIPKDESFRTRVGVVMDQLYYPDNWCARDVGSTMRGFCNRWSDETFQGYLNRFDLDPKKKFKAYSRGMALKIMLAAALSHEAELLLLDEPTSGLDAVARDELMHILQSYIADGQRAVLFSTHLTQDLEAIADYITFLSEGRLLYTGAKDALLEKYVMVKGGQADASVKGLLHGLNETAYGFDGLCEKEKLSALPKDIVTQPCTLDDLIVRFYKGGSKQ